MYLIGDIGGTKARFAVADKKHKVSELITYQKADYEDISEAVNAYQNLTGHKFEWAVLSVNSPVVKNIPIKRRNDWGYSHDKIQTKTGLKEIVFVNDGVAHAMSIPRLTAKDRMLIYGPEDAGSGTVVSVSIGTEVGFAFGGYNEASKKYHFFPSEGGSQLISPASLRHLLVMKDLMSQSKSISWNHITSGSGIANLYQALFNEQKTTENVMRELAEGSEASAETFSLFSEFLGILIHNTAFTFLPFGGIYISGGVLSRSEVLENLKSSDFSRFYEYNLTPSSVLRRIPVYVVNTDNSALIGLAYYF